MLIPKRKDSIGKRESNVAILVLTTDILSQYNRLFKKLNFNNKEIMHQNRAWNSLDL